MDISVGLNFGWIAELLPSTWFRMPSTLSLNFGTEVMSVDYINLVQGKALGLLACLTVVDPFRGNSAVGTSGSLTHSLALSSSICWPVFLSFAALFPITTTHEMNRTGDFLKDPL